MARTTKHKVWHPNKYEKILLAITIFVALICIAIISAPVFASLGTERVPEGTPLLRTFPLQP